MFSLLRKGISGNRKCAFIWNRISICTAALSVFNDPEAVEVKVLRYVHRSRRLNRDGSPGRPPRLSHRSVHWGCTFGAVYVTSLAGKSYRYWFGSWALRSCEVFPAPINALCWEMCIVLCYIWKVFTLKLGEPVKGCVHPPERRPGMCDLTLLFGISGLSFDSAFLFRLTFF